MTHWPRADVLALLGVLATLAVAALKPARDMVTRLADGLWFRLGFPARRYRRKFCDKYRWLDNVYLDKRERLDLGGTYVTLSAVGGSADPQHQRDATAVLADRENLRLIITGMPGSGKSTLLKAYAVGAAGTQQPAGRSADLRRIHRSREVSFLVQLRRLNGAAGIWDHLVGEILISDYGFKRPEAEKFLRRLLRKRRCLVLLDGLDEVPDDRYQAVHSAILTFAEDQDPERPTASARIVLTCRRQNFNPDEWTTFSEIEHVLAPMRDAQILSYLTNRRSDFAAKGMKPERFFAAIEGSATFDLHRTPLVLAMSVALHLERRMEAVPNSISALYEALEPEVFKS